MVDCWDKLRDPVNFARIMWPNVRFYKKQREVLYWMQNAREVFVHAGNILGKDFVAGYIALWFFLTRYPCRVVTTSADSSQLQSVLWGEIRRFIETARYPLTKEKGGPLVVNHLHIRRWIRGNSGNHGYLCPTSYIIGRVSAKGEGLLGHHVADTGDGIPRTLFIADEASGVEDLAYDRADTWAKCKLIIGNPYPPQIGCNFFKSGVEGGDIVID